MGTFVRASGHFACNKPRFLEGAYGTLDPAGIQKISVASSQISRHRDLNRFPIQFQVRTFVPDSRHGATILSHFHMRSQHHDAQWLKT